MGLRAFARMQRCFAKNSGFLLLFFFLNFFTIAWFWSLSDDYWRLFGYGSTLFLALFILISVLQLVFHAHTRVLRLFKRCLLLIAFIPFFIECFVMYSYQALIGAGVVNSILETNLKEAWEFARMYIGITEICGIALMALVAALAIRMRMWQWIHISYHLQNRLLAGGLLSALLFTGMAYPGSVEFLMTEMLPWQRIYDAILIAKENIEAYQKLAGQLHADVRLERNDSKIKNIVFILGESANRNHMHLYGYYLENTPYFDAMNARGDICVFRDVISPHSTTVAVLRKLFTFCDHESEKPWHEYQNLIDVMNVAGYKTFWLSNQESSGVWGNVAQIYANRSTWHKFTRIRESHEDTGILDETLFPLIDEAKGVSAERNFFVVHLMGGHGLYYNRFPYVFSKVSAKDIQLPVSDAHKEIVAQYDNALYYNDYIVHTIIERFKDEEALVIYVPDHGEAVYDEGGVAGHIEENPSRHMIEIPLIVWASEKYKKTYPDKWKALQEATERPYMTDDMIHTILDLADIETSEYQPEKSIVNPAFDASRKRYYDGRDYDTEIRTVSEK